MLRIAIVEDKRGIRNELLDKLKSYSDKYECLFAAENGKDFLQQCKESEHKPALVLMDIDMPIMNGIEAVGMSKTIYPEMKFLMLTIFDDDDKIFDAIQAGCNGYLMKDEPFEKIHDAIEDILVNKGAPMSPKIAFKTLELLRKPATTQDAKQYTNPLSDRETEILEQLVNGHDYKKIAESIFISPNTVRNHIAKIYEKLQVNSRIDAVKIGMKNKGWFGMLF
jgi:DNA-binding NarL/FixJ family response regulator